MSGAWRGPQLQVTGPVPVWTAASAETLTQSLSAELLPDARPVERLVMQYYLTHHAFLLSPVTDSQKETLS